MPFGRAKARPTLRPPGTFGMGLRTPFRLEPGRGKAYLWERRHRRDRTRRKGI